MKHLVKVFIGLLCLVSVAQADTTAPDQLIRSMVDEVVDVVKQDKDIQAGDQAKVRLLVEEKILPHVDFRRMTQLTVGKHWRKASDAQKDALTSEFRNMLIRTYTKAFTMYSNQSIDVKPVAVDAKDKRVTVKTTVNEPGQPGIPVNYAMIRRDEGWKAYDVAIEGISMVASYRGTFDSEIQQNGIDGLINMLSAKNADSNKAEAEAAKSELAKQEHTS